MSKKGLKDAIYGFAIGDALGLPYEFKPRGTFKCTDMKEEPFNTWNQPIGTFSDDTSMTLATCMSIKEKGKINLDDIMKRFEDFYYNGKYTSSGKRFDIGETSRIAIINHKGLDDEYSNGNGSLMRILPLAFVSCDNESIENVSSLTHAHSISNMSCLIYVQIAKGLIEGKRIEEILKKFKGYPKPFNRISTISDLSVNEIKSSGFVVDTLEAALWCVSTTNNYKDCVLKAVNLGNDTDTIAAIAGGLAGIIYGFDSIPAKWIDTLINKGLIDECLF